MFDRCTGAPNSFFPFLFWHQQGIVSDSCFPYSIAQDCGYPCPPSEFQHPRGLGNCNLGEKHCHDRKMKLKRHKAKYVYKLGSLDEEEINFFPESLSQRLRLMKEGDGRLVNSTKTRDTLGLLKRELMAHGPVMLCFSVFESFMHYHEGFLKSIGKTETLFRRLQLRSSTRRTACIRSLREGDWLGPSTAFECHWSAAIFDCRQQLEFIVGQGW